jgi:type VI secretion system ImpA family protein
MQDLETLLAPVSEDEPAGPDLAYDAERGVIEQAFESSVSIDTTGEAVDAADVDWRGVIKMIEDQSSRTKDVWLAVYLCRAGARSGQLELVERGALYLAGLMERYWDTVHPQLEEYGFQGRKGPCESLTRKGEFLGPLERATLLEHPRLGRFSGADFERFRTGAEAEDGYGQFRNALDDTPEETLLEIVQRLDAITAAFRLTDAVLTNRAEGDTGANFQPTYELLGQLKRAILAFTSAPAVEGEDEAEAGEASSGSSSSSSDGPRIAGRVDSREDVVKALDAISDYYRRKEPASPVPVVLQRAREWVNLDFLAVLEDIAPGGLDEAKRVLMSQRQKESGSSW